MKWEHTLLKRYSTTNHFKLINQLKSEISEQKRKSIERLNKQNSLEEIFENQSNVKNNQNLQRSQNLKLNNFNKVTTNEEKKNTVTFSNHQRSNENNSFESSFVKSKEVEDAKSFMQRLGDVDLK